MCDQPEPRQAGHSETAPSSGDRPPAVRLAWLPVLVFGLAVLVLWQMDMRESHESPLAMLGLNLVFSALPALLIAYLMGRSFLYRATPGP